MARIALKFDEMIDGAALRRQLADLHREHSEPRLAILALLKETVATGHRRAEAMLAADGGGAVCARRLSHLMDEVISALADYAARYVYSIDHPSLNERIAVGAVGGYGRGTLAPGSDIDLLFVLPFTRTAWSEQIIEYVLYMLWDMGLKVGHATRSIEECLRLSREDMTIRTAILEARFIWGDENLFIDMQKRFDEEIVSGTGPEFAQAKLAERDQRHRKSGDTRYLVEPNVKDGKGGLRDLHTLFWIGKYVYRVKRGEDLIGKVFARGEYNLFRKAEDFLWAVRCHMHFLTKKGEERLSFDLQSEIAERLGYTTHPGLSAVERFMKHYFLVAKDVGDLTRIFCAALEEEHASQNSGFNRLTMGFSRRRRKLAGTSDFLVDNYRINVASPDVFTNDPINLLRLFWFADKHGLQYHPDAFKLLTRSLHLVDRTVRRNREANELFLDILTSSRNPELNLRRMNETGLLGKFIPDFGKIVAMMQFNMYHHYTVDEHLLRCVGVLAEIEHGEGEAVHPLSHRLMPELSAQRVLLYVAVLLHDIAKGRPEDHSTAGARVARRICPQLGLSAQDTETVAWLIENHLLMSMTAQTRDLNDRKTIEDFARAVQSMERLRLLLVLTVCDIRGVGPGVWNGWKGQLLRTLYFETELVLSGGFSHASRDQRAKAARAALENALEAWPQADRERYTALPYTNYLLAVSLEDQVRHAEFIRAADEKKLRLATVVRALTFEAVTEITILAPDHPRLLSIIAGACSAADANIVDAQIFTTSDGRALDVILINREFERDEDETRRAERVGKIIEQVLSGNAYLPEIIEKRRAAKKASKTFTVKSRIDIRNTISERFSVIDVRGLDRPGLLSAITGTLSDLSLDIASAHITTFGEKVIDTFYVTDLTGHKVTNEGRIRVIREALLNVLDTGDQSRREKVAQAGNR